MTKACAPYIDGKPVTPISKTPFDVITYVDESGQLERRGKKVLASLSIPRPSKPYVTAFVGDLYFAVHRDRSSKQQIPE